MKVIVGQGSCGVATGAKKTAAQFERLIEEKDLDVKVDITGCVGTCYLEPIVDVYDDNNNMTRYVKVNADKASEIVEKHLVNGEVVTDLAISDEDKLFIENDIYMNISDSLYELIQKYSKGHKKKILIPLSAIEENDTLFTVDINNAELTKTLNLVKSR